MGREESWNHKISVIIPAWNEEATVGDIIYDLNAQVEQFPLTIIVVDDASQDHTAKTVRGCKAEVISLARHMGAWGAIQTGFRYALQKGSKVLVTMDADGQHDPACLSSLIEPILNRNADVSIGSFPERGSTGRRISWRLFRKMSKLPLLDLTSGLKAYNRRSASLLLHPQIHLLEYQDLGTLLYLKKAGMEIVEVPVHMQARKYGHSRIFNNWKSVIKYLIFSTLLCVSKYPIASDKAVRSELP
ncbi:MAG: glycosyltransferase family 2 protein [Desulfovermiculus sp.]|nr:glycosyltransferase family 2 protein [Desulfovermiculus sp.]